MDIGYTLQDDLYSLEKTRFAARAAYGRSSLWFMLLVAWHLGIGISACRAQGDQCGIIGRMIDPAQAVVAKATVAARNLETGYTRDTVI
jgi:hypothetical protein